MLQPIPTLVVNLLTSSWEAATKILDLVLRIYVFARLLHSTSEAAEGFIMLQATVGSVGAD